MREPWNTKYELELVFSFHWDRAILRSSFKKNPQSFSNHPSFKASEVHNCQNIKNTRFIAITRVYNLCARIYAQILMKFDTYAHKIVIDYHIKFHEDPSFCCRDIRKTMLVFFNHWFLIYFSYYLNYTPPKQLEMDNSRIIMIFFGN